MYSGNFFPITSFKGGYAGNLPLTQLGLDQAADLDNIVLLPGGRGFRTRHGNQKWHLATLVVQDLTYTSVNKGTSGEAVTIEYIAGAVGTGTITIVDYTKLGGVTITVGAEEVVEGAAEDWVAETSNTVTATNLAAKLNTDLSGTATVTSDGAVVTITADAVGVAGNLALTSTDEVNLTLSGATMTGGIDAVTAGNETVTVSGNAITINLESGTSTATQVKTKFDLSAAAVALATCTVSGTAGDAQTAPVAAANLATTALNSGAPIQGIGHLLQADQDKWLVVVAGTKIYSSSSYNGQYTDISGTVSITSSADSQYTLFTFSDALLGFGGPAANPGSPFRWTGASTAADLSAAPDAYGGFSANNRVFAFRTNANPSSIFWSIIGDATDWTGTGSGSAVIGSLSDGQRVTAAIVISTNYVLVFKENSVHQMVISSAPFPVYSLFDNVGCVGKNAVVNVNGVVYFINMRGQMVSTNGETLTQYPPSADDLWNNVQSSRYPFITGFRENGEDHDWIVWSVSDTGSTNTTSIIWDLENECWLKCSSGYDMNVVGYDHLNNPYLGDYAGFIYRPDISTQYRDDSTSPGTITAYWRSGWLNPSHSPEIVQVRKMTVNYKTKASGNITVNYGFDFTADSASFTLAQAPSASEAFTSLGSMLTGRGNFFQFKIGQSSAVIDSEVHTVLLQGKSYGQKVIGND